MQQNVKGWAGIVDFECKEQPSGDASLSLLTLVCQKKLFALTTILHIGAYTSSPHKDINKYNIG